MKDKKQEAYIIQLMAILLFEEKMKITGESMEDIIKNILQKSCNCNNLKKIKFCPYCGKKLKE